MPHSPYPLAVICPACAAYRSTSYYKPKSNWCRLRHSLSRAYPSASVSQLCCPHSSADAKLTSLAIRPTFGFPSIPFDPSAQLFHSSSRLSSPPNQLPILINSTANEAGQIVQSLFPAPVPPSNETLLQTLSLLVGPERAGVIVSSGAYPLGKGSDTFRETFERIVTDGVWRCSARDTARKWARDGGRVWVGEWTKGSSYVSNQGGGYCSEKGRVCHEVCPPLPLGRFRLAACAGRVSRQEGSLMLMLMCQDDIYPTFGTGATNGNLVSGAFPSP